MSHFVRIKHTIRFTAILLLTLYFGVILALNIPFVQRKLSIIASNELSKLFRTEVSIGNIDLGLLNRVIISDLQVKDQAGADLLLIPRFSAKIDIPALSQQKIRINSVQLFGLEARLQKTSPTSKPNFQFIIDALASKDTVKKENKIDLRINSILIRRGHVSYDVLTAPPTPGKFNANHLNISDLSAMLSLKALTSDSINAHIRRMSFTEHSGFQLKQLSVGVMANRHILRTMKFTLELPNSTLKVDTLAAKFTDLSQLTSLSDTLTYRGRLHADVALADLQAFVPAFHEVTSPFQFGMAFHGKGKQVSLSRLRITTPGEGLNIDINGQMDGSDPTREPRFYSEIAKAEIGSEGIEWILRNFTGKTDMPPVLKNIEFIRFNGKVSGVPSQLTMHGDIRSGVGAIQANVTMHKNPQTQTRNFSGHVASDSLQLGKLLGKEELLGSTAFDLNLNGLKYQNGRASSYIKGKIATLEYKQYAYKDITLDGEYNPGGFNGRLYMDDENGSIHIDGSFLTEKKSPDFNLKATVRNFRPNNLHLTEKYENTGISLNLNADFTGHNIDDMQGFIAIDSLLLDNPDTEKSYFLQSFRVSANKISEEEKRLSIRSSFLNGDLQGRYSYQTIWPSILRILTRYLPSLFPTDKKLPESTNNFHFNLHLGNSEFLQKVLDIPLQLDMPVTLNGYFDDKDQTLDVKGAFPQFYYKGSYYESGNLLLKNSGDRLEGLIRTTFQTNKGAMINLALNTLVKNDRLYTNLYWGNDAQVTYSGRIGAITQFSHPEKHRKLRTQIDLQPSKFIVNDTVWNIHPSTIRIERDTVEVSNFLFEHNDQFLKINGRLGKTEADSCLVDLQNINLQYVMDIIQFHAVKFYALVSGKVHLKHVLAEPDILADLEAKDFSLNDALLGQAKIGGAWDKEIGGIRLNADIWNDTVFTRVNGYVSPKLKGLDLNIEAGGTDLAFLQPFIKGIFSDTHGAAYGNVRLFGPFSGLDLEGDVKANMGFKVDILNTRFEASADSVHITPGSFQFKNVQLKDPEGHTGTVDGELNHTKLKNLAYRFHFNARNMLVYSTDDATPVFPFYGHIYSTGNVSLRGGDNTLVVEGDVRADNRTSFTYVLGAAAEATSNQFITFVDKTPRRRQEVEVPDFFHTKAKTAQEDNDTPMDIHINLQIEPTEQAQMKIIMDPVAGDNISGTGTGNLRISFFNKGEFQIFGNYIISEGIYKLSMQNVIRKDFTLSPGGTVTFNGDPRTANLNVQAVYTVNSASLNDLIQDATTSRGNIRVNCIMNLSGPMTSPNLSFDLELPTVNEEDQELVRSLTSTEDQMNTQIIYLLGIGKFYPYDNGAGNTQSSATSSLAFSTLSGQLNNMLSQVIDSQNWNIGTNLSTGQNGWNNVEAEAFLSGRLLNNRLILNGNFGYKENTLANTNFIGDFEAIWLLTRNGEFRLRGYNQTNDRYFTKSTLTTQGIGLIYKKDFTDWKELLDWFLHRRKMRKSDSDKKTEKQ